MGYEEFEEEKAEYSLPGGYHAKMGRDGWNEWNAYAPTDETLTRYFQMMDRHDGLEGLVMAGQGEYLDEYVAICGDIRRMQEKAYAISRKWYEANVGADHTEE